jgi:RNA polymerase sigma-70 factor, ECF subfamily
MPPEAEDSDHREAPASVVEVFTHALTASITSSVISLPMPIEPGDTVRALTAGLSRGEEQAFRDFHAAYAGRLLRYAVTVTRGDFGLAEEALQASLIRIAGKARVFTQEEAFWAWLACVTRSCVVDCARRQGRYANLLQRLSREPAGQPAADELDREFAAQLSAAIETLDATDRELLASKYEHGQLTADLAAATGCSPKAMESRLARLRQRVRDLVLSRLRHET